MNGEFVIRNTKKPRPIFVVEQGSPLSSGHQERGNRKISLAGTGWILSLIQGVWEIARQYRDEGWGIIGISRALPGHDPDRMDAGA